MQLVQAVAFQLDAVVVVEIVEPGDRIAAGQQSLREMESNEPCRAGNQKMCHDRSYRWPLMKRCSAKAYRTICSADE